MVNTILRKVFLPSTLFTLGGLFYTIHYNNTVSVVLHVVGLILLFGYSLYTIIKNIEPKVDMLVLAALTLSLGLVILIKSDYIYSGIPFIFWLIGTTYIGLYQNNHIKRFNEYITPANYAIADFLTILLGGLHTENYYLLLLSIIPLFSLLVLFFKKVNLSYYIIAAAYLLSFVIALVNTNFMLSASYILWCIAIMTLRLSYLNKK